MRLSFFFLAASLNLPVSIVSAETSLSNLRFYVLYLCEKENSLKNKKKKKKKKKKRKFDFYQRRENADTLLYELFNLPVQLHTLYPGCKLCILHGGSIF